MASDPTALERLRRAATVATLACAGIAAILVPLADLSPVLALVLLAAFLVLVAAKPEPGHAHRGAARDEDATPRRPLGVTSVSLPMPRPARAPSHTAPRHRAHDAWPVPRGTGHAARATGHGARGTGRETGAQQGTRAGTPRPRGGSTRRRIPRPR